MPPGNQLLLRKTSIRYLSSPNLRFGCTDYVMASICKSSLINGLFRRDIPEYPEEAVREAVVNASVLRYHGLGIFSRN